MMLWLVILGVYMGWVEAVYGTSPSKTATAPTPPYDWYAPLPGIPPMYRAEPLVAEAEKLVRSRQ